MQAGRHLKQEYGPLLAKCLQVFFCPSDCCAFIGPSIGPCCYAVGEEVAEKFQLEKGSWGNVVEKQGEKWVLDLWTANKNVLLSSGLEDIRLSGVCTRCGEEFFSYRGDGGRTGRMAAFIKPV